MAAIGDARRRIDPQMLSLEQQVQWLMEEIKQLRAALEVKSNGELVLRKNLVVGPGVDIELSA